MCLGWGLSEGILGQSSISIDSVRIIFILVSLIHRGRSESRPQFPSFLLFPPSLLPLHSPTTQPRIPKMTTPTELITLKSLITTTLTQNGLLPSIKASLRSSVYKVLLDQEHQKSNTTPTTPIWNSKVLQSRQGTDSIFGYFTISFFIIYDLWRIDVVWS